MIILLDYMPKIKPNEHCSCDSGLKYKKCCFKTNQQTKIDLSVEFDKMLSENEKTVIKTENLQWLNSYFLDRYGIYSIDISNIVDNLNLNKIHDHYSRKNIILMCERNENNNSAFSCKGAKSLDDLEHEDIMLIHKNRFLQFNHKTEHNEALKEVDAWLSNKKSAGRF